MPDDTNNFQEDLASNAGYTLVNERPTPNTQHPTPNTYFVGFDPAALPMPEVYRLLVNSVAPRPIAFVSSLSADGIPNLAPFSYFMAGGANPPSVAFSPSNSRDNVPKDTLRNVQATGEYVINVVSYDIREKMNETSAAYPYGISEWEKAGFTPAPTVKVKPARVLESVIALECKLYQIVPHGPGPLSANYVIGEIVYFHVAESVLNNNQIDATQVDYIGRMGGDWYARANENSMFELPRPSNPK